ncbi:hypothetical protein [Nocardia sp. alder85J]|uniref:hypothetical protein n=1 Tax=Nocardia sp. alder85J TaxID=2862949 RepID=UPI001CD2364A|nr:hypothetical protein [Nocardia sp. alder85J]MCX4095773.1 hypothetical protein [Nocardia sp. alder85J]
MQSNTYAGLPGLLADGPDPQVATEMALFGRLIGHWRVVNRLRDEAGRWSSFDGTWDFAWSLGGRAVQDVLNCPSAPGRYPGTTVRCYDEREDRWYAWWLDPHSGTYVTLTASPADDGVELLGHTQHGVALRWVFTDITGDSFHWSGYRSVGGGPYELVQEMAVRRG